ncbi:hypothetical protein [Novosphingobium soli]|uniref:Uncharacterized protein n=1 Tax=Novosphingobium soli TaxID=574956 RepID=A0ABV6CT65_9SPHN
MRLQLPVFQECDSIPLSLIADDRIVSRALRQANPPELRDVFMRLTVVRKGIFRTHLPGLGECARVDMSAGDAAPFLEREMYVLLGFQPSFEQLPEQRADAAPASRPLWTEWN